MNPIPKNITNVDNIETFDEINEIETFDEIKNYNISNETKSLMPPDISEVNDPIITEWDKNIIKREINYTKKLDWNVEEDRLVVKFFRNRERVVNLNIVPQPTPLIKSTHSAKCKLSEQINLKRMSSYLSKHILDELLKNKTNGIIKGLIYQDKYIGYFEKKNKKTYFGHITLLASFLGFNVEIAIGKNKLVINAVLPEKELAFIKNYLELKLSIKIKTCDITILRKMKVVNKKKVYYDVLELKYTPLINEIYGENWFDIRNRELIKKFAMRLYNNIFLEANLRCVIRGIIFDNLKIGSFKETNAKQFDNQCSVLVYHEEDDRVINIKFFTKKSSSLTGCKEEMNGFDTINRLLRRLYELSLKYDNNIETRSMISISIDIPKHKRRKTIKIKVKKSKKNNIVETICEDIENNKDIELDDNFENDWKNVKTLGYEITMINSDYYIGFRIDRYKLYDLLKNEYNMRIECNTDSYAGLKITYFYKDGGGGDGSCYCENKCIGKGKNGNCKKITVIIFQKGNILITGGNKDVQINEVYTNINKILQDNYKKIINFSIMDLDV